MVNNQGATFRNNNGGSGGIRTRASEETGVSEVIYEQIQ